MAFSALIDTGSRKICISEYLNEFLTKCGGPLSGNLPKDILSSQKGIGRFCKSFRQPTDAFIFQKAFFVRSGEPATKTRSSLCATSRGMGETKFVEPETIRGLRKLERGGDKFEIRFANPSNKRPTLLRVHMLDAHVVHMHKWTSHVG